MKNEVEPSTDTFGWIAAACIAVGITTPFIITMLRLG